MKYPQIDDSNFYKKITEIYDKFRVPKKKKKFNEICMPKKYELQLPQKFLANFISPNTPYKGVLVYHRIGAGKTCSAVRIAEEWKRQRKIVVVVPASLKGNFRNELRSLCADNHYLSPEDRKHLAKLHPKDKEYKEIIKKSDAKIDKYYQIYSYNKFIENSQNGKIKLNNTLLIIDEVQNMVSEDGTYYQELYKLIHNSPNDLRVVLLSATPMFDKPHEIALTINLLRPKKEMPIGKDFEKQFIDIKKTHNGNFVYNTKNMDLFKSYLQGYVSYFRGAPPYVFPEMTLKYVRCEMSKFQYSAYKTILSDEDKEKNIKNIQRQVGKSLDISELSNNFFIGTRYASNIVFPNKKVNEEGFDSLTNRKILTDLEMYSSKFSTVMNKISRTGGKVFIYSSFKEYAGLKSFAKVLEANGYKNYSTHGEGRKRFAIWSGDESMTYKEEIKGIYNMKSNLDGSKLKIILGSSSIKEGVSFLGVRQVHILDPYWNLPRLSQVIGRASRFCSHKDLPLEKRNVKVYIYLAVSQYISTIDEYIYKLSMRKNKLVNEFEKAIKEGAIDCHINKHANMDGPDDYVCDE